MHRRRQPRHVRGAIRTLSAESGRNPKEHSSPSFTTTLPLSELERLHPLDCFCRHGQFGRAMDGRLRGHPTGAFASGLDVCAPSTSPMPAMANRLVVSFTVRLDTIRVPNGTELEAGPPPWAGKIRQVGTSANPSDGQEVPPARFLHSSNRRRALIFARFARELEVSQHLPTSSGLLHLEFCLLTKWAF